MKKKHCSRCKQEIYEFEWVETIEGLHLCYGCDAKRLEEEEGYETTKQMSWK
jgi:hypothetical protein